MPWPVKHGLAFHPLYRLWMSIRQRCTNPKEQHYADYGGRGIKMYSPWINDVTAFVTWVEANLGSKPSKRHTLDRRENDGNYEPGNLRWATWEQQARNKRPVRSLSNYSTAELKAELQRRQHGNKTD